MVVKGHGEVNEVKMNVFFLIVPFFQNLIVVLQSNYKSTNKLNDMDTALLHSPLNETQKFVMHTFLTARDEQEREEITSLYLDYIQQKLDKAANQFWEEQNLNNTKMEELMYGHLRYSKK